jgi:DNA modification methylase
MLLHSNALHIPLRDESVQMVCTSPPYYGLRDYGIDGIGLEDSLEAYLDNMCVVFDELWRVLRDDGVVWLNMGSSFCNQRKESEEMVLQDDLTPDEIEYVLKELAHHVKNEPETVS